MGIIYSLTNRTNSIVRGVIFLILGIALLFWPANMLNLIVQLIAAFLIATGVVTLVFTLKAKSKEEADGQRSFISSFATVNVVVYICFGALIFIFPGFFVSILVFLFGVILLMLGLGQLANLFLSSRHTSMPAYFYIVPVIITICGIMLFFQPFTTKDVLTMFFGACVAMYGIEEIISGWMLRKVEFGKDGKFVQRNAPAVEAAVEDVPYEEVPYEEVKEEK